MRILAVDDDAVILEILEVFLATLDYEDVVLADCASAALSTIEAAEVPFDCILLDINMPQMTGIELIPLLRKIDGYAHVPIIMLTALDDRKHIADAFIAGAWDYIVKPFEVFELEARIHSAELRNAEMNRLLRAPSLAPEEIAVPVKVLQNLVDSDEARPACRSSIVIEDAFENCIQRAVGTSPSDLGLIMIQLADFDGLRSAHTLEAFDSFLVELGRELTASFMAAKSIVSYQGKGTFVALSFRHDAQEEGALAELAQGAVTRAQQKTLPALPGEIALKFSQVLSCDLPQEAEPLYMLHAARTKLEGQSQMEH